MAAPFEVYRVFAPNATRPPSADGLDLSALTRFRDERRPRQAFVNGAAERIARAECFFADAQQVARDRVLPVPSPFGGAPWLTPDIVACPSTPWHTVPLYVARVAAPEPFALVKRGLSWCMDLGLAFPTRRLFVSLQEDERWLSHDIADLEYAETWFAERQRRAFESDGVVSSAPPTLLLTSGHFAHHLWNELSVLDGLIAAGVHGDLRLVVSQQPIAPIRSLFPEIPASHVAWVPGPPDRAMDEARRRHSPVVPAGRRLLPASLIARVLRVAHEAHPDATEAARSFQARHGFVLWVTLRLDARTATNLIDALTRLIAALRATYPTLGVIVDGFTTPAGAAPSWNLALLDAERRALPDLARRLGDVEVVALPGRSTLEAFIWATAADYYVCPYGSAHHKVAWIHPIPGTVHAGDNMKAVSTTDAGLYARQMGPTPSFFFSPPTRVDAATDARIDLVSYTLDVDRFVHAVRSDIATRVPPGGRRESPVPQGSSPGGQIEA